jgi:hypothetical protein
MLHVDKTRVRFHVGNIESHKEAKSMKTLRIAILAIKYWLRGESWDMALEYAQFIVLGFQKSD